MMDMPKRIQIRLDHSSKSSSCIEPSWDERRLGGASVSDSTLFDAQEVKKKKKKKGKQREEREKTINDKRA